jgi:hypothetical protein
MYFVVSTGRAGSRTLADSLNRVPGTVCLHHPQPELAAEATEFYCGSYPRADIEKILRETRRPVVDGKVYGEVNLQHTLLFPVLRELFPQAQFVWLLRDGRDSVASMYYRGWYDERYPRQGVAWRKARLHGDKIGDFSPTEWQRLSRFERCCWLWKKFNLLIEAQLTTLDSSHAMTVRLDRLKSSMPKLLSFLGLGITGRFRVEQLNVARQPVSYWTQWTPGQRSAFEQACGTEMDRWFPEWRSPSGIWRPLSAEPIDHPGRLESLHRSASAIAGKIGRRLMRPLRSGAKHR